MWLLLVPLAIADPGPTPHLSLWLGAPVPSSSGPVVVGTWSPGCASCSSTWHRLTALALDHPDVPVVAVTDDPEPWIVSKLRAIAPPFAVAVDGTHTLTTTLRGAACGYLGWNTLHVIVDGAVVWSGRRGVRRALDRATRGELPARAPATCLGIRGS